jgi:radical SAM protein with 4Fe4S-binding SPASM domain
MSEYQGFEGFPLHIGWELTLACNLCCSHCASSAGLPRPNELTTEEALSICDQFPDLLVQQVDFTGGEPLLRRDWLDIALHLKDLGIPTNMVTNGQALVPETVTMFKQAQLSSVAISLDGLEDTHDRIRNRSGSFKHVIRALNLLKEENITTIVITTVNKANIFELADILTLLKSLEVRRWRLQPLIPEGRVTNFRELEMGNQEMLELGDFIRKRTLEAAGEGLQIICSDGLQYIVETKEPEKPWRGCPAGWVTCGITSEGKVKGCLSLPDELIEGDLRKRDLWDIWFDPDSFVYSRRFSPEQIGANCRSCDKVEDCKGGCSSSSYAFTGHFHDDPCCFYGINNSVRGARSLS